MRTLGTLLLMLLTGSPAWSWGGPGHQAIAEAAQGHLDDRASRALAAILFETDVLPPGALAGVAKWPDEIRSTFPPEWSNAQRKEAKDFNQDNPTNANWHFVNLPLGASEYPTGPLGDDPIREFVREDDIVHAINRAIEILEKASPEKGYSKKQAVRWLVHLVGDIHQPCHTTAGYYDPTLSSFKLAPARIDAPALAARDGILADRGGNGLLFAATQSYKGGKLHGVWDGCLPNVVLLKAPYSSKTLMDACEKFAEEYSPLARALSRKWTGALESQYQTSGSHRTWAAAWATESLQQAVKSGVYDVKLKNGRVETNSHGDDPYVEAMIIAPSKQTYVRARVAAAEEQLMKATIRLVLLLNAIDWR